MLQKADAVSPRDVIASLIAPPIIVVRNELDVAVCLVPLFDLDIQALCDRFLLKYPSAGCGCFRCADCRAFGTIIGCLNTGLTVF